MKLGKAALEALQAEVTGRLLPGNELVVVGAIALEGTSRIVEQEYMYLQRFFSEGFLQEARNLPYKHGIGKPEKNSEAWRMALEYKASALIEIKAGGVLSAVWKMAEASGVGLEADLRKIPIRQETIEICEKFDINPYRLLSEGAFLAGVTGGEAFAQACQKKGITAAVIGCADGGNDRLLYSGENARYLERPAQDEISKVCEELK